MRTWKKALSLLLVLCMAMTLLPTAALAVDEPDYFDMEDFGAWGESWAGAYNVGWKLHDDFNIKDIQSIEVGMKDDQGALLVKYFADTTTVGVDAVNNADNKTQISWQKYKNYITTGGHSSAPFYQVYDNVPLAEGIGPDWTITKGSAFDAWDPATCYVIITTADGACEKTNVVGAKADKDSYAVQLKTTDTTFLYKTVDEAVTKAGAGDTITLLDGVTLTAQLNIDKAITLDGNNKTITRTPGGTVPGDKAGILVTADATLKDLTVSGPNATKPDTEGKHWDEGEFGIKVYNTAATLDDVSVTAANAGIQVNGAQVTMTGTIDVSGNEYGGIEVCHDGATLDLTGATLVNKTEADDCPVLWNDDTKGTITQSATQKLFMSAIGENKDHYYLSGVAKVGNDQYATLAEAIGAVGPTTGSTVTLLRNQTLTEPLVINNGQTFTLDLGGNTLSSNVAYPSAAIELKHADLTIENGTVDNTCIAPRGVGVFVRGNSTAADSSSYSVLTLAENATIKANYGVYVTGAEMGSNYSYGTAVNINGTIEALDMHYYTNTWYGGAGIFVSGNIGNTEASAAATNIPVITINNGAKIIATDTTGTDAPGLGVAMNGICKVNVTGGSITADTAIPVKRGSLTVSGGSIAATGALVDPAAANTNGTEDTGAAISVTGTYNYSGSISIDVADGSISSDNNAALYIGHSKSGDALVAYTNGVTASVSGGNFIGKSAAVYVAEPSGDGDKLPADFISGGYFSSDPSAYLADGYQITKGSWNGYTYRVEKVPENKIVSATAVVNGAEGKHATAEASVVVSGSSLTVSGKLPSDIKTVVITYTRTDGKTGTVTLSYDAENKFTQSPTVITVGSTTYTVDISDLTVLPAEVKVAAPTVPTVAEPTVTTSVTTAAVAAINEAISSGGESAPKAEGLGSAVANETLTTTTASGGETVATVTTTEGVKTVEQVITAAKDVTIDENATDDLKALKAGSELAEEKAATIVVVPVLEIKVVSSATEAGKDTLTMDISALSQVVVTNKNVDVTTIQTEGSGQNAIPVGEPVPVKVNTSVTITVPIPNTFIEPLYVRHTHDGVTETVLATINSTGASESLKKTATFTLSGLSEATFISAAPTCTVRYYDSDTATDYTEQTFTPSDTGNTSGSAEMRVPTAPSGKRFAGWKLTETTGDAIASYSGIYKQFTDAMLSDLDAKTIKAVAQFENIPSGGSSGGGTSSYTLTFNTNGGSAISKVSKTSGTTIDLTGYKPTRDGYTFAGWFSDSALTKAVTSIKLTANTTVYAKWTATSTNPFADVAEDAYYYNAVLWAAENGVTSGTSATTFAPNATCTRAQTVTFLWRAMGSPEPTSTANPFTDVSANAYYYKAVLWAVEKGITNGTSATTFSPDATVTRGQVVTFQYRAAGSPAATAANPFTDVTADDYFFNAVLWAAEKEITSGTSTTTFSPSTDCTRAQIVTFLFRQLGK